MASTRTAGAVAAHPDENSGGSAHSQRNAIASASSKVETDGTSAPVAETVNLDGSKPTLPWAFIDCPQDTLITLITHMLNMLIQHNDQVVLTPDALTRFHSRAAPEISVEEYLRRIVKYTNMEVSASAGELCLILIEEEKRSTASLNLHCPLTDHPSAFTSCIYRYDLSKPPHFHPLLPHSPSIPDFGRVRRVQSTVRRVLYQCALCQSRRNQDERAQCAREGIFEGLPVDFVCESLFSQLCRMILHSQSARAHTPSPLRPERPQHCGTRRGGADVHLPVPCRALTTILHFFDPISRRLHPSNRTHHFPFYDLWIAQYTHSGCS